LHECFEVEHLALDPVADVNEGVDHLLGEVVQLMLEVGSLLSRNELDFVDDDAFREH